MLGFLWFFLRRLRWTFPFAVILGGTAIATLAVRWPKPELAVPLDSITTGEALWLAGELILAAVGVILGAALVVFGAAISVRVLQHDWRRYRSRRRKRS